MDESKLNTIIKNSYLYDFYFSHKISDPKGGYGIQNPFDGFCVTSGTDRCFVYWEAKLLKKIEAFNFGKIEDHQYINLDTIYTLQPEMSFCIYPVGIWMSRKWTRLFVLEHALVKYLKSIGKKSILQKEFYKLIDLDYYITLETKEYNNSKIKIFDVSKFKSKCITKNMWNKEFCNA